MRFLHTDFVRVSAFLAANPTRINRLEWELHPVASGYPSLSWTIKRRDAHPPQNATVAELDRFFEQSMLPPGSASILKHYFHLNPPPTNRAVSLSGAVEHVEAFGGDAEFLIAGHPNGGVVSVSRWELPFQTGLPPLKGWGP